MSKRPIDFKRVAPSGLIHALTPHPLRLLQLAVADSRRCENEPKAVGVVAATASERVHMAVCLEPEMQDAGTLHTPDRTQQKRLTSNPVRLNLRLN